MSSQAHAKSAAAAKAMIKLPRRSSRAQPGRAASNKKVVPVRVRMFRQGLGDCFLLTFDPDAQPRHILIDCGTLGAKTTGVSLRDAAGEIAAAVGRAGIDLLVVTHEHWDHVAGFDPKSKLFDQVPVKRVWLAWTEDPSDALAKQLARDKSDLGRALQLAVAALGSAPGLSADVTRSLEAVNDLMGFGGALGADGVSPSVNAAMNAVRIGFNAPVTYLAPGHRTLEHDWLPGFRIYVLGPPRRLESLSDLGEHGSSEIYGLTPGVRAGLAAAEGATAAAESEDQMPFAPRCRFALGSPEAAKAFPEYFAAEPGWRRIDGEWLRSAADAAEELALQLDSMTNNTSLVLAIERIADGKVMLFPADAQEGNWLSWHDPDVNWTVKDTDGTSRTVRAADLLQRTVFYKVGHHASHNATASTKGLELMKGKGLTAFIPVDRAVALTRNPKGSWRMPARKLYRRLLEKCDGRVVRADLGWAKPVTNAKPADPEKEFEQLATPEEWSRWTAAQQAATHVRVTPTYVEFTLL